jgi:hypothetical protein
VGKIEAFEMKKAWQERISNIEEIHSSPRKTKKKAKKRSRNTKKVIRGGKISRREVGSRILEKTGHEKVVWDGAR